MAIKSRAVHNKDAALDSHAGYCYTVVSNILTKKTIMAKKTEIDPRFMKYNKDDVEALLDKVAAQHDASESDVRSIVTDYSPEGD